MKVRDLVKSLKKEDQDRVVICQKDSEGNGFRPLVRIAIGAWDSKNQEPGLERLTEKDRKLGYTKDDVRGVPALFLVPKH